MQERTIGRNIQLYRHIRGISQKDLAAKMDATTGTLSHIERGTRKPSLEMLCKAAEALGVSIINLVLDSEELDRFYYDEQVEANYAGSVKLQAVLQEMAKSNKAWNNVRNVAIVNLDTLDGN